MLKIKQFMIIIKIEINYNKIERNQTRKPSMDDNSVRNS